MSHNCYDGWLCAKDLTRHSGDRVLGLVAATDALARGALAGRDPQMFYIIGLTDILIPSYTMP